MHETIRVVGAGFAPSGTININLFGQPYHTTADSTGGFRGTIPAPAFGGTRARVTLAATDGQNSASTRLYLTDVKADFNPSSGAPSRLKVRFTITGLGAVLPYSAATPTPPCSPTTSAPTAGSRARGSSAT